MKEVLLSLPIAELRYLRKDIAMELRMMPKGQVGKFRFYLALLKEIENVIELNNLKIKNNEQNEGNVA